MFRAFHPQMVVKMNEYDILVHSIVIDESTGAERPLVRIESFYEDEADFWGYKVEWCEAGERLAKACIKALRDKVE